MFLTYQKTGNEKKKEAVKKTRFERENSPILALRSPLSFLNFISFRPWHASGNVNTDKRSEYSQLSIFPCLFIYALLPAYRHILLGQLG